MTASLKTIIYPVKDLALAKGIFTELLGAEPVMDEPYYVQYNVAGQEIERSEELLRALFAAVD